MTLEELRAEAKKLGYRLTRETKPMPHLLPCSCGRKRIACDIYIERYYDRNKPTRYYCYCPGCWKESKPKPTMREAREEWNAFITKQKEAPR